MLYWNLFKVENHKPNIKGKRKFYDTNIYTFDIETSSYYILDNQIYSAINYDKLNKNDKKRCIKQSNMYIWMFGINDVIYYGRTWDELKKFLLKLDSYISDIKYVFIHNLAFEFQYLKSEFHFEDVMARKARKVIMCKMSDYNIILKCSYMMSNVALEYLPKMFNLNVEKKVGDLDYDLLRHSKTPLTEKELGYCEYDCLVLYEYICKELEVYEDVKHIPTTNTGKVRRELKELVRSDFKYRRQTYKSISTNPIVYNRLTSAFMGGYTHSNWINTSETIKNVDSYDISSSYPFVLCTERYPSTEFLPCKVKSIDELSKRFCYILVVKFIDYKSKYFNHFISMSKCQNIKGGKYDNGRIIEAKEFIITITDIDFKFYLDTAYCKYEILECYYSVKRFLPKTLINFILEKYVSKTELKNVEGKEMEYGRVKGMYNSIYGMSVTNNIRSNVIYDDITKTWEEKELTNDEIVDKLIKEKKKAFMSFSTGLFVTAYARDNLLRRVIENDDYVVYCDTDSCKLKEGYNKDVFTNYNKDVLNKIEMVCKVLNINPILFSPKDIKGNVHTMGLFEKECTYQEFKTEGAKKYAYKIDDEIHITVSGVPKKAAKALKSLDEFTDDFVFEYKDSGKKLIVYNDNQDCIKMTDYLGFTYDVKDKSGICILPNSYKLSKALEYSMLLGSESSERAKYKEGKNER